MADVEGIKSFLYSWLQQNKHKTPEYTFLQRSAGRGRLRFICELHVDGMDYVGIGNSVNKKDSQTNAARDFTNYLVREKYLSPNLVPCLISDGVGSIEENTQELESKPVTSRPQQISVPPSNRFYNNTENYKNGENYINRIFDQKKLEEAEEIDLTADIHGGWSMENAKSRLNEYLQVTKQQIGLIKYTSIGPDHNRSFLAESTVYAKKLNKELYARETGSNKLMASRACCLSLVRQLFHAGEIEAFTGLKRKRKSEEVPTSEFDIEPEVERRLDNLLENLGLVPSLDPPIKKEDSEEPHNMITNYNLADFEPRDKQSAQLISWCPPAPNWNPWTSCNIDEGPESTMPLHQISKIYLEEYEQQKRTSNYLSILSERKSLPAHIYKNKILDSINNSQLTLIKGETGSGKTTQVPQFILDSFLESNNGANCSILVTQPRRICAISLAERMAYERNETIGTSVGYSVRFETVLPRPYGSILFCTVGTLCRKMESGLRGVSHLIIDEIHERDVNTDFMLILIRDMMQVHKDLRIVLMSATIDTTMFDNYFHNPAIVELEGRTHPVTHYFLEDCISMISYVPPPADERKKKQKTQEEEIADAEENCNLICPSHYPPSVALALKEMTEKDIPFGLIAGLLDHICAMDVKGAVLIFLPGWNTISTLKKFLQTHPRYGRSEYLILPLHSQVPREDQRLVFRPVPVGVTKVVLSTNIAESSITINDVVFVIDSCLARVKMFTARNNMTTYSTVWASKNNLEQRRGRAGRVQAGFAFHLCSQARFERIEQHSTPEILLTPLHELALMIKLLRLGDVSTFLKKAIQPPPLDAVVEAEHTLKEMKALDSNDELTPLGQILARLPLEPRLGRMIVFSCAFNIGGAMCLLAAQSSLGNDPFIMPPDRRRLSNEQLRFSANTNSDHLTALNVFQVWSAERERNGENAADYFCEIKQLNAPSLRVMEDAATQIRTILISLEFPESSLSDKPINFNSTFSPEYDLVSALLVTGNYPNIAFHTEKRKILTAEGKCALVHKGSVNCLRNRSFSFPLFTFGEKIRTQAVSCKALTMVTPVQLLLFGCRTATWHPDANNEERGIVLLDEWMPFHMDYASAARIFALRPALDALLVRVCLRPSIIDDMTKEDNDLIEVAKELCSQGAYKGEIGDHYRKGIESSSSGPRRFNADFRHPLLYNRNRRVGLEMDTATFDQYEIGPQSRNVERRPPRSGNYNEHRFMNPNQFNYADQRFPQSEFNHPQFYGPRENYSEPFSNMQEPMHYHRQRYNDPQPYVNRNLDDRERSPIRSRVRNNYNL